MSTSQAYQPLQITLMRTDPAGRAAVSQRGSNSKMRARERRRSELGGRKGGFVRRESKRRVKGGKTKQEKQQYKEIGIRGKWILQACTLFFFKNQSIIVGYNTTIL